MSAKLVAPQRFYHDTLSAFLRFLMVSQLYHQAFILEYLSKLQQPFF